MESMKDTLGQLPDRVVADAGYGSEKTTNTLKTMIEAYIKYSTFHKETSKKWKDNPQYVDNLHYNSEKDVRASHDLLQKQEWVLDTKRYIRHKEVCGGY
jgi:hypothetical protein